MLQLTEIPGLALWGSRVSHPKIFITVCDFLELLIIVSWLFLRNKKLRENFDFPPDCLKDFRQRTWPKSGGTITDNWSLT